MKEFFLTSSPVSILVKWCGHDHQAVERWNWIRCSWFTDLFDTGICQCWIFADSPVHCFRGRRSSLLLISIQVGFIESRLIYTMSLLTFILKHESYALGFFPPMVTCSRWYSCLSCPGCVHFVFRTWVFMISCSSPMYTLYLINM